ncbi:MAG: hypothetical protein OJJ55_02120 [Rhodococcus sp.]|uniref:hypothetical protein n=1 Tax=Rhodococcus erythropolis TaxID=1833 RepID=UPI000A4ECC67|nr:hypothetical protein [Rhodococcus erythropolis]MCW0190067.1 hypothetical protein [Rhodococcus sp. (in: high G+C Gram-positive bacteria)]
MSLQNRMRLEGGVRPRPWGQAGTVMLKDGQCAYWYNDGAELIMTRMSERPAAT